MIPDPVPPQAFADTVASTPLAGFLADYGREYDGHVVATARLRVSWDQDGLKVGPGD
jgi:hypothetical protein